MRRELSRLEASLCAKRNHPALCEHRPRERLGGNPDALRRCRGRDTADLFIHKRCGRLIVTLPALQHDPNRPEVVLKIDADEDGIGGDDAADALRYLVATKSRAISQRKLRGL